MGLFSLRVQRFSFCSIRAENVWISVPNPLSPMMRLSCNLKTRWKSLARVNICLPKRRSAAIPTQSLPTMPTRVPPLYSNIDILKVIQMLFHSYNQFPRIILAQILEVKAIQIGKRSRHYQFDVYWIGQVRQALLINITIDMISQTIENFNHNSIDYKLFSQSPPNPQKDKIYAYRSRIKDNMKDNPTNFTSTQTKFYNNKIFHSSHKYQVPNYDCVKSEREDRSCYQQFYSTHRKFTKPYGELTKYSDTLNKNASLLRRSQFDTPVTIDIQPSLKSKTKTNRVAKYFKTTRPVRQQPQKCEETMKVDCFDKTINGQYTVFRKLLGKERSQKSDWIGLNNSMNRILAAELIDLQTNPKKKTKTIEK